MELIQYSAVEPVRLDKFLSDTLAITRSKAQELIESGHVTVNEKNAKASTRLQPGDQIRYQLESVSTTLTPKNIPLSVIYEDDNLLIINKPKGLLTHPTSQEREETLVNALLFHQQSLSHLYGEERAGIVHRIDKDTSGLLVIAKNNQTHAYFADLLKTRQVKKYYIALIHGVYPYRKASISLPLSQNVSRRKIEVNASGRNARTDLQVIKRFQSYTLVRLQIFTGRTHQIRVHLAHIGFPVAGDRVYGKEDEFEGGQLLHAHQLSFVLPEQTEETVFFAPMPDDFLQIIKNLP